MTNDIKCPYCNYVYEEWWELINPTDMEGEFDLECEYCNEVFHVEFETSIEFTSSKNIDFQYEYGEDHDEDEDEDEGDNE